MNCKQCTSEIAVDCGYETPKHGYCYPCASELLDEILTLELPPSELHMRPTFDYGHGTWVVAHITGALAPELAKAAACELLRASIEALE